MDSGTHPVHIRRMSMGEPLPEESELRGLVHAFYDRVRADATLGPVFNGAVDDWPEHLERLTDFWCSVVLGAGRYKGNPLAVHLRHLDQITPEHFTRWLELWRETTHDLLAPEAALALQTRADRIGRSLQLGMFYRPGEPEIL